MRPNGITLSTQSFGSALKSVRAPDVGVAPIPTYPLHRRAAETRELHSSALISDTIIYEKYGK